MSTKGIFKIIIGPLFILITGCAGMNSHFDCPMKPGVMCASVDQVNRSVDQGNLGTESAANCKTCSSGSYQIKKINQFANAYPMNAINLGDPIRFGETVMRIWIAPYEDSNDDYYQPTIIYTVIKPGHWIGNPPHSINADGVVS